MRSVSLSADLQPVNLSPVAKSKSVYDIRQKDIKTKNINLSLCLSVVSVLLRVWNQTKRHKNKKYQSVFVSFCCLIIAQYEYQTKRHKNKKVDLSLCLYVSLRRLSCAVDFRLSL